MILWINGAFGSGKTTVASELHWRIPNSFIYDPENIGYFMRKNSPKQILKDDFQDHFLWREFNFSILQMLYREYTGTIIVPMTIVNPNYFDEIVNRLRADGVELYHFTLLATRETLLKRLKSRRDNSNSWPAQQIDRCIKSLSQEIFRNHIQTDHLTPEEIIDQIAMEAKIQVKPDNRGKFKKKMDRLILRLKHIRI